LSAPVPVSPGDPNPQRAPGLYCRSPIELRWNAVANASEYAVTLETLPTGGSWRSVTSSTVRATTTNTPAGLNGAYRWSVRARSGQTSGPASAPRYFNCAVVRVN
jgi:hypothetical protein